MDIQIQQLTKQNQILYPECPKEGYHLGEKINMICIDENCEHNDNKIGCCACMEILHNKCKVKPIKLLIYESQNKQQNQNSQNSLNPDEIIQILDQCQQDVMQAHEETISKFLTQADKLKEQYNQFYDKIKLQIFQKANSQMSQSETQKLVDKLYFDELTKDQFIINVQKFIQFQKVMNQNLNVKNIIDSVVDEYQLLKDELAKLTADTDKQLEKILENVKSSCKSYQLPDSSELNIDFKFGKYNHPDIKIINKTTITSNSNNGYKFALLDPPLPTNKICKFSFKINKKGGSDWMAVGIAHRQTVQNKGYLWTTNLGHGGYMISSQAYSWSTIDSSKNSQFISFPYKAGDIIWCDFDPFKKIVTFTHKVTKKKCEIPFNIVPNDPIHPCVLFYYNNYEVEFFKDHK